MSFTAADLLALLDVETIEADRFRGRSPQVGWPRVFGGLVVAQALVAASRTAEGRLPHALHGFFLRPGDTAVPIELAVMRLRDGRSFATRQCIASQNGVPIMMVLVSFQRPEAGLEHQVAMPLVPPPDQLPSAADLLDRYGALMPPAMRRYLERDRPVEMRPVDLGRFLAPREASTVPVQHIWMRAASPLPDDPAAHRAMLAYMSDMTLLDTALVAHRRSLFDAALQVASLDHALWFHRPVRADQWMLYAQDSPSTAQGRGFTRGLIFAQDGRLVASVAQEGLIRQRRTSAAEMPTI